MDLRSATLRGVNFYTNIVSDLSGKAGINWYTYVMNTTQTLVKDLISSASALKVAKESFAKATIVQVKAERILNNARNLAIVEGKATGSNESQRTASLSQILAKESKALDSANDKLTLAKLAMDLAYIDNQTNRYAIKAVAVTED